MSNRRRPKHRPPRQHGFGPGSSDPPPRPDPYVEASAALRSALLDARSGMAAAHQAAATLRQTVRLGPDRFQRLMQDTAVQHLHDVCAHGWTPTDLGEVVRRRLGDSSLPVLAGLLAVDMDRHPADTIAPAWRVDVGALGAAVDPRRPDHLATVLATCGLVLTLPEIATVLPVPGTRAAVPVAAAAGTDRKVLARVRALLAKAESTEYAEEAESLSAKAQQLISRHALDRMALEAEQDGPQAQVRVRRMWLDPPYVLPKAHLVDAVSDTNECRTLVSDKLGFCTLVGEPADLDAVELLATSLLVQADRAMLQRGSRTDGFGTSRTRSFRRSFLVSFAARIRERLQESAEEAVAASGQETALVPLLAAHRERVEEKFQETFPRARTKSTTVSNGDGWREGRVAADRARLEAGVDQLANG